MTTQLIITCISLYFIMLMIVAHYTSRNKSNDTFFTGNKNNHWLLIAFGMIGSSLSGVTFLSIPGTVEKNSMFYMQIAFGYILGYLIIAFVLLPIYYRYNLTSIYTYLKHRFGPITYKTGSFYFLISRLLGSSVRLYLVANIFQIILFKQYGLPFWVSVLISIVLIWLYTNKGGIKTIIYTDTLQTAFMLASLAIAIVLILNSLDLSFGEIWQKGVEKGYTKMFQTDNFLAGNYWIKGILGGMFITIAMTGVDQDMMQKNLSCKNLKDAQKNMVSFSLVLVFINLMFLILGVCLFVFINENTALKEIWMQDGGKTDALFATIALKGGLGSFFGVIFILGLIAAAYSSADSALTALTTSFCIDFLDIENKPENMQKKYRQYTHIGMSFLTFICVLIFNELNNQAVIDALFKIAGYTYGPLLGLFFFGILSKRTINDKYPVFITIIMMFIIYFIDNRLLSNPNGFKFGFELLGLNAILTMLCLHLFSSKKTLPTTN